jgi:cysteinyl-tRNA synthetase
MRVATIADESSSPSLLLRRAAACYNGQVSELILYDSFQRQKVPFQPLEPGKVGMYVCGPTPYAPAHIGHAYSAIAFDTIRRSLRYLGYQVTFVRNITDVEDKIIREASKLGEDPMHLAARFSADYNRDMARFAVLAPDIEPLVSTHIAEIIALITRLIAAGKAYVVDGDVNYEVATFAPYGRLSGQTLEELRAGARVEVDERKRSPEDFALWKSAKPGEPSWESPWGLGRPGWHIECSAMTCTHLGERFDLHGGGKDLIFPHHENEIAQSQGAFGEGSFARYWMHNGFLNFAGEKMSKSLGNVFNCEQIAEAVGGEALRFFCVSHHYRSPVDFEVEVIRDPIEKDVVLGVRFHSLETAERRLDYFYTTLARLDAFAVTAGDAADGALVAGAERLLPESRAALCDDFNTPVVLAAMGEAARLANKLLDESKGVDKLIRRRSLLRIARDLRQVGVALGILASPAIEFLHGRRDRMVRRKNIDVATVTRSIEQRGAARAGKDFARADELRRQLTELGIELLDTPSGTDWRVRDEE